jgi:glycerophosphoryl diester phosphodiesterase
MVEIDLRQTKDGVIVLLHGDSLDRTTSLSGPLCDKRYAELKSARLRRASGGPDSPLIDQHIPSFEEALAVSDSVFFFLDIKEPVHDEVFRLLEKHHALPRVLFSMNKDFGPALMQARFVGHAAVMPKLAENIGGTCVADSDPEPDLATYAKLNEQIYELVFCDDRFMDEARSRTGGARLWVNTLGPTCAGGRHEQIALSNPDAVWGDLLDRGVNALQTDYPNELIAYLRKTGKR